MKRSIAAPLAFVLLVGAVAVAGDLSEPERVFRERILPILRSPDPSSCTECHLAAVDLKDFLRPTADETFLSLRDRGLVDVKSPTGSKILTMIRMAPVKPNPIASKRRDEEARAFEAWIVASCAQSALAGAPPLDAAKRGDWRRPVEVIRHERDDQLLARFVDQFWRDTERCASCHAPPGNQKQVDKFGDRVSWIVAGEPRATMTGLAERKLLDIDAPEKSLILRKPSEQVTHGGGRKILIGDETYTRGLGWIRDYARAAKDGYAAAKDLPPTPPETDVTTDCWVRVELPASFDDSAVSIEIFPWDAAKKAWATTRIASASRHASKGWQQTLYLHAPRGSDLAGAFEKSRTLPKGRYLVRVFADKTYDPKRGKPARIFSGKPAGELDVDREWPAGYGSMNKLGALPGK